MDVFADHLVEKSNQAARYAVEIDVTSLQHLSPGERQKLTCENRGAAGLFANARKSLGDLRIATALFEAQFSPSQNSADNIVEIVCDAARKLSNCFELLHLPQLPLHRADLGDVFGDHFDRGMLPCKVDPAKMQAYRDHPSVPPPPLRFGPVHLSLFAAGHHELGVLLRIAKNVAHQVQRAQVIGGGTSQDARDRRVVIKEGAVHGNPKNPVCRVLDQIPITRFRQAESLLAAVSLRDVDSYGAGEVESSVFGAMRVVTGEPVMDDVGFQTGRTLDFDVENGFSVSKDAMKVCFDRIGDLRRNVMELEPHVRGGGEAVHLGDFLVHAHEAQVAVKEAQADGHGAVEEIEFGKLPAGPRFAVRERGLVHHGLISKRFLLDGPPHRARGARKAIFQNVVVNSLLDALNRGFFSKRAGNQQKRNVFSARAQFLECL